jgi:hypothetical protein
MTINETESAATTFLNHGPERTRVATPFDIVTSK